MIWQNPLARFGCDIMQSSIKEQWGAGEEHGGAAKRGAWGTIWWEQRKVHGVKKRNEMRGTHL